MIMPYMPPMIASDSESAQANLVVEVERDVFVGLLQQGEKPLVFEHRGGLPRTYRYFARFGAYYFLFRSREKQDLSSMAHVLPVVAFHASPTGIV